MYGKMTMRAMAKSFSSPRKLPPTDPVVPHLFPTTNCLIPLRQRKRWAATRSPIRIRRRRGESTRFTVSR
ncbi:MAG: hypothetical protein ABIK65_15240 [Candidatus Eisenbacteria bacterium]